MKKLTGTVAELVEKGIKLNGRALTQPYLSALAAMGDGSFCRVVGEKKSGKGRAAKVWEFDTEGSIKLAVTK